MAEYQKLNSQIELIQTNEMKELKTMTDLGSHFYAQAHIQDTTFIYVNVGFGFHVQFTLNEAKDFIKKKEEHLQKQADKHSGEADKIRAHIKMLRTVDWILYCYFLSHIPITLLLDLQAIYPPNWVPQPLLDITTRYIDILNDPLMNPIKNVHMYWFKSFVFCEAFLQLPFFFVAAYGVYHKKLWIRLPLVVYGTHVATTVIPCLAEIAWGSKLNYFQTFGLLSLYLPYFLIPLLAIIDSVITLHQLY
ncbi:hypothetical protein G6F57_004858 [Rhizopus arrhizus]|nr:hypothetical protein G6F23_001592 [Rhizopus arrhizus]KAG0817167.1 hypothetical protein G6F20_002603 [Rhizopus arrhizus]KAG0887424.1 hypothetical protein G6F15_002465 [Rhizopus arrhizus]KAG0969896.1 hypothetical protein G6F31_001428 [Rhizopus arrhizus]KAG0999656.1 hypothetical protein G6F28_000811 [Rhizopus arrhizus]